MSTATCSIHRSARLVFYVSDRRLFRLRITRPEAPLPYVRGYPSFRCYIAARHILVVLSSTAPLRRAGLGIVLRGVVPLRCFD